MTIHYQTDDFEYKIYLMFIAKYLNAYKHFLSEGKLTS